MNNLLTQTSIALWKGMLVNKGSRSKHAINKRASCSHIHLANSKESFKVNSLEVKFYDKGTNIFANL